MKREKAKTAVLKRATNVKAGRRLAPKNPDAVAGSKTRQPSVASACLPEGEARVPSSMLPESIAPRGLEFPQAEEMLPSSLRDSSDTLPEEAASTGETLQRLAFILGNEEYGIDIRLVKEIIRLTVITPVPRSPSYVRGIISLRGRVLPILDLCQMLLIQGSKPTKLGRILVVRLEEMLIGIIVDAVTEVVELKEEELQPPPTLMTKAETDHIIGMGRYKGRMIILLDLEKVYMAKRDLVKSAQG
jgi:purine-binding chemotaxis protein CheW